PVLVAAGLIMESFEKQQSIDPGFESEGLLTFRVQLPREAYDEARSVAFSRRLLERVQGIPGVESAVLSSDIPLSGGGRAAFFVVEEHLARDPESETRAYYHRVSPGFFQVAGIPMVRGQGFTARASDEESVEVVISKSFADKAWSGQDPIGKRIARDAEGPWWVVAGVVNDVRYRALLPDPEGNPEDPDVYRPIFDGRIQDLGVIVKTRQEPEHLAQEVQRRVRELDPSLPIFEVATLDEIVANQTAIGRFSFILFGLFGALALILIAIGIYGVTSYSVSQRVREIGVRMALGETPRGVLKLVLREALWVTALGLGLGLLAAWWSVRLLESLLFGVPAMNPSTFALGLLIVFAMALVACSIPAWRASRYDPMLSLKAEN
ncbi:MAG TPA: FtsX-like permease family protein, partial [Thermoanaerobaculia bacterium]